MILHFHLIYSINPLSQKAQAQVQVKNSPRKDFCAYLPLKQLSQALFFVERIG